MQEMVNRADFKGGTIGTARVQANTSPAFPPVPDDGASPMTGIETADVGDNLDGMQP